MNTKRTTNQIACDGVKTAWQSDAFTEILHHQVATHFSMDGVIPNVDASAKKQLASLEKIDYARKRTQETVQQPLGQLIGVMDGVRLPWKRAYRTT